MGLLRRPWIVLALGAAAACGSDAIKDAPGGTDAGGSATPDGGLPDGATDSGGTPTGDAAGDAGSDGGLTDPGPFPLGATWGTQAVHFRVMADPATALELDLYTTSLGAAQVLKVAMTRAGGAGTPWAADVPHAQLATVGITSVVYYGYRAWGPNWTQDPSWTEGSSAGFVADVDGQGNRFDPNKLLIDPYTREISHDPLQPGSLSSTPYSTGSARATDDGPLASKSIVVAPDTTSTGTAPTRPLKDDIIYEVNVRGLTMSDTTVLTALQGTYAGAATKATALAALGVTAVELLPIHETQNDQNDADPSGANYWGYSTLAFFAPDRRYSSDKTAGGPTREFKAMVAAFHAQGIKVFLDVVYNHTAEGGPSTNVDVAKLLSWRGLDNADYYELAADHASAVDDTGVGGNFNTASTVVRNLVIDSLTYWHGAMGVDGFRFDVAPVLGNTCTSVCFTFSNSDPAGILQRALVSLPGVALIAEPWGTGNGTYQLGNFPAGWSEWNGQFRDQIRTVQNELGTVALAPSTIADRVTGSPDIFNPSARAPWASINYVDCHDGFTLSDEYSYDAPDNDQAYPYGPSTGGSTTNDSWDQGGVLTAQQQAARTGLALVLVSSGVPMFQGGDEMLRTQYGNNNAYNLDDSAMWLDPALATTNAAMVTWTHALIAFRTAHAALRPAAFLDGTDHNGNGLPDVGFLDTTGAAASAAYMADTTNHFLAWRLDGTEAGDAARSIYVAYNGWSGDLPVTVPAPAGATTSWWVSGDSASGSFAAPGAETALGGTSITVKARSVAVLVER